MQFCIVSFCSPVGRSCSQETLALLYHLHGVTPKTAILMHVAARPSHPSTLTLLRLLLLQYTLIWNTECSSDDVILLTLTEFMQGDIIAKGKPHGVRHALQALSFSSK